jgi:hypothetical protein
MSVLDDMKDWRSARIGPQMAGDLTLHFLRDGQAEFESDLAAQRYWYVEGVEIAVVWIGLHELQ